MNIRYFNRVFQLVTNHATRMWMLHCVASFDTLRCFLHQIQKQKCPSNCYSSLFWSTDTDTNRVARLVCENSPVLLSFGYCVLQSLSRAGKFHPNPILKWSHQHTQKDWCNDGIWRCEVIIVDYESKQLLLLFVAHYWIHRQLLHATFRTPWL